MSEFAYGRDGVRVHFKTKGMNSDELRCLILALWWILGAGGRADTLAEMRHYADRSEDEMPGLTRELIAGYRKASSAGQTEEK